MRREYYGVGHQDPYGFFPLTWMPTAAAGLVGSSLVSFFGGLSAGKWYASSDGWQYAITPNGRGTISYKGPAGQSGAHAPYSKGWNAIVDQMGWSKSEVITVGGGNPSATTAPTSSGTPSGGGTAPQVPETPDAPFYEKSWFAPVVAVGMLAATGAMVWSMKKGKRR